MNLFDQVYSLATDNHGVVTTAAAVKLGVKRKDLNRWVKMGRLVRYGRGVYRATQYPHSAEDPYAIAVAEAGNSAYLCGESVLALLNLAPTNPRYINIAVPNRIRRKLDEGYRMHQGRKGYIPMIHEGMPIQKPLDAIRDCIGKLMSERLEEAAQTAYEHGYLYEEDRDALMMEIRNGNQATA